MQREAPAREKSGARQREGARAHAAHGAAMSCLLAHPGNGLLRGSKIAIDPGTHEHRICGARLRQPTVDHNRHTVGAAHRLAVLRQQVPAVEALARQLIGDAQRLHSRRKGQHGHLGQHHEIEVAGGDGLREREGRRPLADETVVVRSTHDPPCDAMVLMCHGPGGSNPLESNIAI